MAAGLAWAVAVVWIGAALVNLPVFSLLPTLAFAFLPPGLVFLVMLAVLAGRRHFAPDEFDTAASTSASRRARDERVLRDTTEQLVLALALWPAIAYLNLGDGPGVVMALGFGWAMARLAFWIGHRRFGFAATAWLAPVALAWGLVARLP